MSTAREKKATKRTFCIHLLLLPLVHPTQNTSTQTLESSSQTDSSEHFTLLFCSVVSCRSFHDETLWSRLFLPPVSSKIKNPSYGQSPASLLSIVKSSSQQTFTRGAQLIPSLKTGSFLGCFCEMMAQATSRERPPSALNTCLIPLPLFSAVQCSVL